MRDIEAYLSSRVVRLLLLGCLLATGVQAGNEAPASTNVAAGRAATDATNTLRRVHVFVSGRVQGVGFRDFTRRQATLCNVHGWVKNLTDGRVELVAEGLSTNVAKLLIAVAKGPPAAAVDKVEPAEEPCTGEFTNFDVRP